MRDLYRPRWPLLLALILGVGAVIAFTYLPSEPSAKDLPERGGVYTEGVAGEPSTVNPLFVSFNEVDRDISSLVFAGLVRLGPRGEVQPDLADVPRITPDGLNYIFELRPRLFWHDGVQLDADDVRFTIETIQDPDFTGDPALAELFEDVEVEVRDARTVIMTLPEPFSPFLSRGATVGILPEHLLEGQPVETLRDAPFSRAPVGSGPFELASLTTTEAALEPFDSYHLGRPFLERMTLRFYRDDGELLNALVSDEVDGALFRPGLDPEDIALIDGDPDLVRRSLHTTTYSLVYLSPQVEPFADPLVRAGLQRGTDRQTLIERALAGQAIPMQSPIVPDLWAYVPSEEEYSYDPDQAATFLNAAGWVLTDGMRTKVGDPFSFTLSASDDPIQTAVAEELVRQWGELGIEVELEVSGASQFVESVLLPRQFEAALVSVDPGPDPDPYPLWHSSQAFGDGRNLVSYSNPDVDHLLENGRQTNSTAERAEAYRSFQEIFARDLPSLLLYTPTYQYVVRADVQGLSPGLLLHLSSRFDDAYLWYVEKAERADVSQ